MSDIAPPTVSVVVASYNHAGYLVRRMQSLIDQTYASVEILVVDDRSPDNSVEVLQQFAGHPRITIQVRETNVGWVVVSNEGFAATRGEFVLFANCDDACAPQMIERLVASLRAAPGATVAFCRSRMVDGDDRVIGDDFAIRERAFRERCAQDTVISGAEMRRFLMHSCVIPNLSAALFRRDALARVGLLSAEYRACSDWDLFFKLADIGDVAYVAEPLNDFRQHATTVRSVTKGRVAFDEFCRVLLGELRRSPFTASERWRFRCHVMYLWAIDLLAPGPAWRNIPFHVRRILSLDAPALLCLPIALAVRVLVLPGKVLRRAWLSLRASHG